MSVEIVWLENIKEKFNKHKANVKKGLVEYYDINTGYVDDYIDFIYELIGDMRNRHQIDYTVLNLGEQFLILDADKQIVSKFINKHK